MTGNRYNIEKLLQINSQGFIIAYYPRSFLGTFYVKTFYFDLLSITNTDLHYILTPLSTVLLDVLTGYKLVKKFPAIYGTRGFIAEFTSARQLFLS